MAKRRRRRRKTVPLGCYLTEREVDALFAYSESLELSLPSVCRLIIQHELCSPRLGALKDRYRHKVGKEGERVTARFADRTIKDRFIAHIKALGLPSGEAVGILFRAEPDEQWLRRAVGESPLNPGSL
jgi:hypothetical protein